MRTLSGRILVCGLLALLSSCTLRMVDFTAISTKSIDWSRAGEFKRGSDRVEGEDSALMILIIPLGIPHMKEAIDRAIESVPGAVALVDGVVSSRGFWFLIGESAYVVEGTPLIDPMIASAELPSNRIVARLDGNSGEVELDYVDEAEYERVRSQAMGARAMEVDSTEVSR